MSQMAVYFQRINEQARIPEYAHSTDGAADLFSNDIDFILGPGQRKVVSTGIKIQDIEAGWDLLVTPKSGLAARGITVLNSPGLVDNGYRGEIKVILYNAGDSEYLFAHGDKIAQIRPIVKHTIEFRKSYTEKPADRGDNGFGSTGTN